MPEKHDQEQMKKRLRRSEPYFRVSNLVGAVDPQRKGKPLAVDRGKGVSHGRHGSEQKIHGVHMRQCKVNGFAVVDGGDLDMLAVYADLQTLVAAAALDEQGDFTVREGHVGGLQAKERADNLLKIENGVHHGATLVDALGDGGKIGDCLVLEGGECELDSREAGMD